MATGQEFMPALGHLVNQRFRGVGYGPAGPALIFRPPDPGEPSMALGATIYVFTVRLADADRGVYETLSPLHSQKTSAAQRLARCRVFAVSAQADRTVSPREIQP